MKKMLSALLALCMVLLCLPVSANAEVGTDSVGSYTFSNFEDLKTLAAGTYEESVLAYYTKYDDFVLDESLSIPENLDIHIENLVIPSGVTLTIQNPSSTLYAENLTVIGSIVNYGYLFLGNSKDDPGTLVMEGNILNYGAIDVYGIDAANQVKNVTYYEGSYLLVIDYAENMEQLKAALTTAEQNVKPNWEFDINLASESMAITESITVPANTWLTMTGKNTFAQDHAYTLAKDCTLTVNGSLYVVSPLRIEGTIDNQSFVCVESEYGAKLEITETGSYQGAGDIYVTGITGDDPYVVLPGLDQSKFYGFYTDEIANGIWVLSPLPENTSKLENTVYAFYQMSDLTVGADGAYRTPDGALVYIAVNNVNDGGISSWLDGHTLYEYVEKYGEDFFDLTDWEALKALMDAEGYVVLTDESLAYLITTIAGNPQWGETEEHVPYYLFYDKPVVEDEEEPAAFTRIFGATRYQTAFEVADQLKENLGVEKFQNIVVAYGEDFADALSGSYLANQKNAPILLVKNRNKEINAVKEYIMANLAPGGTVYLLGGVNAVPKAMESGLEGFTVKRLAGATRYETNLAILEEAGASAGEVLVCTGKDFADGLSASAVNLPILLVKDKLSQSQINYLTECGYNQYYIIGGKNAVNIRIENALKELSSVIRIEGATRYYTSVNIAKTFFTETDVAVVAYAQNFPDGLSGGCLAYSMGAPLILTANGKQAPAVAYTKEAGITGGVVLGGPGLVSDKVANAIFQIS